MGEIKSTLELAMERTKKMAISDEEKEEIKRKEILDKATVLFNRYGEGYLPLNGILKEIERMEEKKGIQIKEVLVSKWIEALSLNEEDERLLKGIESLRSRNFDEVKREFHHLLSQYKREKEKVRQEVRFQLEETLRKRGMEGSAVEPNIEVSELWEKELGIMNRFYGIKLKKIQEQLKAL